MEIIYADILLYLTFFRLDIPGSSLASTHSLSLFWFLSRCRRIFGYHFVALGQHPTMPHSLLHMQIQQKKKLTQIDTKFEMRNKCLVSKYSFRIHKTQYLCCSSRFSFFFRRFCLVQLANICS